MGPSFHPPLTSTVEGRIKINSTATVAEGVLVGTSLHPTLSSTVEGRLKSNSFSTVEEGL